MKKMKVKSETIIIQPQWACICLFWQFLVRIWSRMIDKHWSDMRHWLQLVE